MEDTKSIAETGQHRPAVPLMRFKGASRRRELGSRRQQHYGGRPHRDDEDEEDFAILWEMTIRRGSLVRRLLVTTFVATVMSMGSFATTTVIIDTFNLNTVELGTSSRELSTESNQREPILQLDTERFRRLQMALSNVSSSVAALGSPDADDGNYYYHSPQALALDWLANRDELQLNEDAPNLVQRYVLTLLFYATNGPNKWERQLNWLSPVHECEWKGDGGVRASLKILYLARNKLEGTIPTSALGRMSDLSYLGLQHNSFSGTVPSKHFSTMANLRTVRLEKNDLIGTIPKGHELCRLKLKHLSTDCRQLVKWKDPEITCDCCTKCFLA